MASSSDRDLWKRTSDTGAAIRDRLPLTKDWMLWGVVLAVVVALVLRLLFLGERVAHYDEGRVAYWSLHTLETGHFAYRYIIHGPLLQHLDRYLFALFGASDFVMRFPVAVIGGLLPASALLFRKHLRRTEVVAMAFVLALNPVLLYYSRFMRSDVLVAAFMFTALGFLVRFYDTRRHRYLYAATAIVALGIGSKENAVVYVLTWGGAAALLADQALFRPREYDSGAHLLWAKITGSYRHLRDERVRPWIENASVATDHISGNDASGSGRAGGDSVDGKNTWAAVRSSLSPLRFAWYLIAIAIIGFAILLFIFAPRGAGDDGLTYPLADAASQVGLWDAVGNPGKLPELINATWHRSYDQYANWFTKGVEKDNPLDAWISNTGQFVRVMGLYAGPTTAFALFGFIAERYGAETTRNLVLFSAYGGFVAIIGYPLGTDIWGSWLVVHTLVPLSIPAAVGVGVFVRWGRGAYAARDGIGVGIAVLLLVLATSLSGLTAINSVYSNDQSETNHLVQYAQPGGEMQEVLAAMDEAAADNEGIDVIIYDTTGQIVASDRSEWERNGQAKDPMCANWHDLLPLPWYFAKSDAQVDCVIQGPTLTSITANETVPIIITRGTSSGIPVNDLDDRYVQRVYRLRTTDTPITYWVSQEYADQLRNQTQTSP